MSDGLKEKYRRAIIDILSADEKVERIVLFGSRAMRTFRATSDVDIALFGDRLTLADQARFAGAWGRRNAVDASGGGHPSVFLY